MIAIAGLRSFSLGPVSRIPVGEGRCFTVNGLEIAVFHSREGEVYATQALCPHRNGPLADGMVGQGTVVCPLHSRGFDLASGEPLREGCPALRTYRARVGIDGDVIVEIEGERLDG